MMLYRRGWPTSAQHKAVTFFEHKPATWQRLSTKAHVVMPLHSGRHFTQLLFALPSDDGAIACFGEHGTIYYIDSYAIDVENESSIPHHACNALCVWAQAMLDLADAKGWGGWHMGRGVNLRKATRKIMRGVSGLQPAQNLDCAVWVSELAMRWILCAPRWRRPAMVHWDVSRFPRLQINETVVRATRLKFAERLRLAKRRQEAEIDLGPCEAASGLPSRWLARVASLGTLSLCSTDRCAWGLPAGRVPCPLFHTRPIEKQDCWCTGEVQQHRWPGDIGHPCRCASLACVNCGGSRLLWT